jgi:hypothetical protein
MLLALVVYTWLVVANAAALSFIIGVAALYQFSVTNPDIQIGLSQLGAQTLGFFVPVIVAAIAISTVHILVVLYSLGPTRRLVNGISTRIWWQRPRRIEPAGMSTVAVASPRAANTRRGTTSALVTSFWSRNSAEITRLFNVWEVVLQTFQAYKISYLVASVSINRLVVLVIVINCWFVPLLQYVLGSRPMVHIELGRLIVDSSLDLIYNVLIPLSIFYPYYRDYDGSVSLYPNVFYYDDTWYVNAVSELRQVFVTSWPDFISKFGGSVALVYQLWKVKAAMDELTSRGPTAATISDSAPVTVKRAPSYAKPRQWYRSRISCLLDFILVAWGAAILSFHLTTTITSFRFYDPDCLLEMRPWGSLAYSCASFEISCSKRHTTGDRETMETILRTVDPLSMQNLILSNCEQLHVPSAIQRLKYLSMLKIYNSTIASWDVHSALRELYHPQLQVIYLARVNASSIPDGLLAEDFPRSVWDLEVCITNILTFPPAVTTAWANVGIVAIEGNPDLREFPEVLISLRSVFALNFGMNNIKTIASDLFQTHAFVGIGMNGNPIEKLPDSIGGIDQLAFLRFVNTKVSGIPASWMDIAAQPPKPAESVVFSAGGSPLCETTKTKNVTKPAWMTVNCELQPGAVYSYPIREEDAWRRVNQ